jgi:hypothetical protein
MKPDKVILALVMLTQMLSLPAFGSRLRAPGSGCNPDGNQFDLESPVNAPLVGQVNESVGFILGRGGNGVDLVVGAAQDARVLNPEFNYDGFPMPSYYVQRDNSNCAADFEGGLPAVGGFIPTGHPQVAADPAHDAFFIATSSFESGGEVNGVGIVKSASANLLNGTNCPNGTQNSPAACWNIGGVANQTSLNTFLGDASIAVDQRTQGTGSGDVYVTVTQQNNQGNAQPQISLTACTNSTLTCSSSVIVSGNDTRADYSSVQVRPDGGITVSYANVVIKEFATSGYLMKFVDCTPHGAPNPPTCSAPILVTKQKDLALFEAGDETGFEDLAYPRHVDRLEADGKTVTTFLIFDQCAVAEYVAPISEPDCPKTQVVVASSTNGGNTWSSFQPVSANTAGQQFLGDIALDASTGTVNIAYYSSQSDSLNLGTQVFLAQILPGQSTIGSVNQLTTALFDAPFGCLLYGGQPLSCSAHIGVAAAGTGQTGHSRAYVHFTGSTTNGSFNGQAFPIYTNTLTQFSY